MEKNVIDNVGKEEGEKWEEGEGRKLWTGCWGQLENRVIVKYGDVRESITGGGGKGVGGKGIPEIMRKISRTVLLKRSERYPSC